MFSLETKIISGIISNVSAYSFRMWSENSWFICAALAMWKWEDDHSVLPLVYRTSNGLETLCSSTKERFSNPCCKACLIGFIQDSNNIRTNSAWNYLLGLDIWSGMMKAIFNGPKRNLVCLIWQRTFSDSSFEIVRHEVSSGIYIPPFQTPFVTLTLWLSFNAMIIFSFSFLHYFPIKYPPFSMMICYYIVLHQFFLVLQLLKPCLGRWIVLLVYFSFYHILKPNH